MNCQAVIGVGYGDEGKGRVVSYLCGVYEKPLVIRFCGGHQAGHHVVIDDKLNHVFSNFGSGTLQGVDTYWSRYCTIDPVGIVNELAVLKKKGIDPILYIDGRCPVTTPFDKEENQRLDRVQANKHGTCGVGFGQTLQREADHYSLLFSDLFYKDVFIIKMNLIKHYYSPFAILGGAINDIRHIGGADVIDFLEACVELVLSKNILITDGFPDIDYYGYSDLIFEGSQGLLLDQGIGFFPHVTRAHTGTKNIGEIGFAPDVYLVTRAYQTRHGNGPMTNESIKHRIKPNPVEQQEEDGYQGKFRIAPLDLSLLKYAMERDEYIRDNPPTLVITCMDLVQDSFILTIGGKVFRFKDEEAFIKTIKEYLHLNKIALSRSANSEDLVMAL